MTKKIADLQFVICGTGRSGTAYAAHALTAWGIPTGHEAVFTYDRSVRRQRAGAVGLAGDSSFAAVAYLNRLAPGTRVLHLVRDPVACLRSWLATWAWRWEQPAGKPGDQDIDIQEAYREFFAREVPELRECSCEIDRAIRYLVVWTHRIPERCAALGLPYRLVHLERFVAPSAARWLAPGITPVRPEVETPHNVNAGVGHESLTWGDAARVPSGRLLFELAAATGYLPVGTVRHL